MSAKRLWDKGTPLDPLVQRFTVGDDPIQDLRLLHWDCLGSAAHARVLARAELLSGAELTALLDGLREVDGLGSQGRFEIPPELEDVHTAIEAALIRRCGAAGEKLHAGRSRNDQVATAMRLYLRHSASGWLTALVEFGRVLLERLAQDGCLPLPGYTHMQPAMPSSAGQWLHGWVEGVLDLLKAGLQLQERLDACPLGTGAGFGVPLPLDRGYSAALLGFSRIQRSPTDVQNARGRLELLVLRFAVEIGSLLEKLANDLLLFSTAEFGLVRLPEELTTGSSIMPQKRNPDVLELLRARAARLRGRASELEWIVAKLPSSYHRDLQLTKAPVFQTDDDLRDMLRIAGHAIGALEFDPARLSAAMRPELYAVHAAYEQVRRGVPFRQAYRQVAAELRAGRVPERVAFTDDPARVSGDLLETLHHDLHALATVAATLHSRHQRAEELLA